MVTYSFNKFCQILKWNYVNSIDVKKITPNGFNNIEGSRFIVAVRVELKGNKVFKRTGKTDKDFYSTTTSKYRNLFNDEFSPLAIIQVENEELHKIIERG